MSRKALVTRADALAAGLSSSAIERLCRSGRWQRKADGVYAAAGRDGGPFQQIHAELLAAGPLAFAQRRTAAKLLSDTRLDLDDDGKIDLAILRGGASRLPRRRVPEAHLIEVDGMRCADGLLTLLVLASVLGTVEWEWALEAALREGLVSMDAIEAALAAPSRRRDLDAVRLVRDVLRARPEGAPPTGSVLETRFVQLSRKYDPPTPERQVCVEVSPTTRYFVDFAWPAHRFFLEVDGRQHDTQGLHDADRLASIMLATGWGCCVLRWDQIVRTPRYTAERMRRLLDRVDLAS
jgi:hypothetical protein